jgi:hypothetical protein
VARRIIEPISVRNRSAHECPRCGGEVHRVPRTNLQRLLVVVYPAKRYRCADPSCRWDGLLRSRQLEEERRHRIEGVAGAFGANTMALLVLAAAVVVGLAFLWLLVR